MPRLIPRLAAIRALLARAGARRYLIILTLCASSLAGALYAQAAAPTLGERAEEGRASPARLISLMPALTEATCMLGACERLVATDQHSDWPVQVQKLPKLASLDSASLETLIRLKPDLILAHPGGRLNERLKALGFRVLELRSDNLQDIRHALLEIERALNMGLPHRAEKLWSEAQAAIQAQAKTLALSKKTRVYIEIDSALYAAGPSSYLGEILSTLGAHNIVPKELTAFPKLAPEFVLKQRPDVLMQLHSGPGFDSRPGWQALDAIKRGRVCHWNTSELNILVRPGPRLAEASALMAACLHKARSEN
jgi:iron complex transport system substrate-binding protein